MAPYDCWDEDESGVDSWNSAIDAALRAAKRGFQSKVDKPVKERVYERIKALRRGPAQQEGSNK